MALLLVLLVAQAGCGLNLQLQSYNYMQEGIKKYNVSDFRGALETLEKGLAVANRTGNKQAIAGFFNTIGLVYNDLGDYPKALSHFEQSLKINKEIGDTKGEEMTLNNLVE